MRMHVHAANETKTKWTRAFYDTHIVGLAKCFERSGDHRLLPHGVRDEHDGLYFREHGVLVSGFIGLHSVHCVYLVSPLTPDEARQPYCENYTAKLVEVYKCSNFYVAGRHWDYITKVIVPWWNAQLDRIAEDVAAENEKRRRAEIKATTSAIDDWVTDRERAIRAYLGPGDPKSLPSKTTKSLLSNEPKRLRRSNGE